MLRAGLFLLLASLVAGLLYEDEDPCFQPKIVGPCQNEISRFYFNQKTGACEVFRYSGCGANDNNFLTMNSCNKACNPRAQKEDDPCDLPRDLGTGIDNVPRYYFDSASSSCRLFRYTGEGGNTNNFPNLGACQRQCVGNIAMPVSGGISVVGEVVSTKAVCLQPRKPDTRSPCKPLVPRYYFNKAAGVCVQFYFGGCDKNGNNFVTMEECMETCMPNYNSLDGRKKIRVFGVAKKAWDFGKKILGGFGHKSKGPVNPCTLDADPGPCRSLKMRYYFSHKLGRCLTFNYGGCKGNDNNFLSEVDCLRNCGGGAGVGVNAGVGGGINAGIGGGINAGIGGGINAGIGGGINAGVGAGIGGGINAGVGAGIGGGINAGVGAGIGGGINAGIGGGINAGIGGGINAGIGGGINAGIGGGINAGVGAGIGGGINAGIGGGIGGGINAGIGGGINAGIGGGIGGGINAGIGGGIGGGINAGIGGGIGGGINAGIGVGINAGIGGGIGGGVGGAAGNPCILDKATGPCRSLLQRYYFNRFSGRCEQFTYGGCQGNANNFEFLRDCEARCVNYEPPPAAPRLPSKCWAIYSDINYKGSLFALIPGAALDITDIQLKLGGRIGSIRPIGDPGDLEIFGVAGFAGGGFKINVAYPTLFSLKCPLKIGAKIVKTIVGGAVIKSLRCIGTVAGNFDLNLGKPSIPRPPIHTGMGGQAGAAGLIGNAGLSFNDKYTDTAMSSVEFMLDHKVVPACDGCRLVGTKMTCNWKSESDSYMSFGGDVLYDNPASMSLVDAMKTAWTYYMGNTNGIFSKRDDVMDGKCRGFIQAPNGKCRFTQFSKKHCDYAKKKGYKLTKYPAPGHVWHYLDCNEGSVSEKCSAPCRADTDCKCGGFMCHRGFCSGKC